MLKLVCPGCQQAIPTEDVNVSTDLALCRRCHVAHPFSHLLRRQEISANVNLDQRPAGVWERTTPRGVAFGASHRSLWGALGALGISLFWNGIVSVFMLLNLANTLRLLGIDQPAWLPVALVEADPMGWGMTIFLWLFLTPFLLIGAAMIGAFFMALAGRTEVRIDPNVGSVFIGVGPLGWRRKFRTSDVRHVGLSDERWTDSDGDRQQRQEVVLELADDKKLKFGAGLKPERRAYLAALVQRTLG